MHNESPDHPTILRFTVDAALFRELGERLVGQPQIALAELVKNSYDADALAVEVRFSEDRIEVRDNGHGMTFEELTSYWMRVGSAHKERQERSRNLGRPLTGSKGVGRLAAQFLATNIELRTVSEKDSDTEVVVKVDWRKAVQAGDLTAAEARCWTRERSTSFPDGVPHGTVLILTGLNQAWGTDEIVELAKEVWTLQPPFHLTGSKRSRDAFDIRFESPDPKATKVFEDQIQTILKLWQVKVSGELQRSSERPDGERGHVDLALEFSGGERELHHFRIPDCELDHATFEVRVYELKHRQPGGIRVGEARKYLKDQGGVYVYDAGFRLPYYGPDVDWLRLDLDTSRRVTISQLLPDELQVERGMLRLANNQRLFGVVRVDTAAEARAYRQRGGEGGGEHLKIQVTRDRLASNQANEDLIYMLRWAIDLAAMAEARRQFERVQAKGESTGGTGSGKALRVGEVLERYRSQIPKSVFGSLRKAVDEAVQESETEAEALARRAGLLGSLATAGMAALAYEHEVQKQYQILEEVADGLEANATTRSQQATAERVREWIRRARATRGLFSHLMDEENRDLRSAFVARSLLRDVWDQLGVLARGVTFEFGTFDPSLRLPPGEFAQWSALFQNLLVNAVNAVADSEDRRIRASAWERGRSRGIRIEDTGVGVDVASSERLFAPFVRESNLSPARRALGAGGSGLGLTIVRMIAADVSARVQFVEPSPPFKTAVEVRWTPHP